jgi:hypothetical protein
MTALNQILYDDLHTGRVLARRRDYHPNLYAERCREFGGIKKHEPQVAMESTRQAKYKL